MYQRLPFFFHVALAEAAVRIEDPRANLLGRRVPADDLHPGHVDAVADLDGEGTRHEVVVPRPVAFGDHRGFVVLIDPASDHPFQLFQLLVVRRDDEHVFLGHAVQQPLAVTFDVDGGVLAFLRCLIRDE